MYHILMQNFLVKNSIVLAGLFGNLCILYTLILTLSYLHVALFNHKIVKSLSAKFHLGIS